MRWVALPWACPPAISCDGRGERVEAVHARSALAGALLGQPARDARGLGDRAGVLGEQQHDARAERGAVGGEMFV